MWPSPVLLAVSAVSQYLIRTKKSTALALILESAEPREVHHFATLLGYGACAVNPYLAHETIGQLIDEGLLDKDYYAAVDDYDKAILNGIVKIASKMGISTIQSYQSSQIFEAVGIYQGGHRQVLHRHGQPCGRHRPGGHSGRCGGPATTRPSTRWAWTSTWSWSDRRCPQVPQRQGRAPVQSPDHPSVPEAPAGPAITSTSSSTPALVDDAWARRRAPAQPAGLQL